MITAEKLFGQLSWCNKNLPDEPGFTRPSYSEHETKAMGVIASAAREIGIESDWDAAGNLHVVHPGDGSEVVTGSHLDSVPNGGPYDGAAGVVAGLLALQRLHAQQYPRRARLIVLRGEESAWFGKCYLGSMALFGEWTEDILQSVSKEDGQTLRAHVNRCGGGPNLCTQQRWLSVLSDHPIGAFIEVHIEQGPVLHEAGEPIGIVTAISGNYRYPGCSIVGQSAHSGTTPMTSRHDAVMAFAELMRQLELSCPEDVVVTCGVASTSPGSAMSIVPGRMDFSLEFRSGSADALMCFNNHFLATQHAVAQRRGVQIHLPIDTPIITYPVALDGRVRSILNLHGGMVTDTKRMLPRNMPSGAGHDAAVFQKHEIPTGMVFIRNEHGSHNPQESMRMDDFYLAVEVLTRTMMDPGL